MNNAIDSCPVCGRNLPPNSTMFDTNRIFQIDCTLCGQYQIGDIALSVLKDEAPNPSLSGILRLRSEIGQPELVTRDNYKVLQSIAPASNDVPSKLRYLLRHIARKSNYPGEDIELSRTQDYSVCFGASSEELHYLVKSAEALGFLTVIAIHSVGFRAHLTPNGWEEIKRLPTLESSDAFVAMSFAKEPLLNDAWEQAIEPAIGSCGYRAVRVDKEEYLGDIVFEIIARMRESRFVLADVTEHKNGVYFEGGYAMGLGLPVIWMCHEDDIDDAHFDTSHLNHLVWSDLNELRKNLENRILATIGRGPLTMN